MIPRIFMKVETIDSPYGTPEVIRVAEEYDANVVTSLLSDGFHAPVLDIDFGAQLIPSSTPGHFHLYVDKAMTWRNYRRLLKALGNAGVLEPGYVRASIRRGHSAVRKPGLLKLQADPATYKTPTQSERPF